ncbi:MAG: SRPBCC family protein [Thiobacillaceae bacterium]
MSTFKTSRSFSAPPEAVFAALSSPERLAQWWGPDGFSNTFENFEFKNGGVWRFTMHGPDGSNYPNEATFSSIEPNRGVVVKHVSQPHFTLSIRLEPTATGTTVTWEQAFESPDVAASIKHIVEPANEQNLSRWQAEVAENGRGG